MQELEHKLPNISTNKMNKKTSESRVVLQHGILPKELNSGGSLYGAILLEHADHQSGACALKHTRRPITTASLDSFEFLHPFRLGDILETESFISGVGDSSVEVFTKFIGENDLTGERYLGAISFVTFKVFQVDKDNPLPGILPETEEERFILSGYEERRKINQERRHRNQLLCKYLRMK